MAWKRREDGSREDCTSPLPCPKTFVQQVPLFYLQPLPSLWPLGAVIRGSSLDTLTDSLHCWTRSHPSLYTPSLPLLLPILPRAALGELLPLSSRLLLSVQLPQGLHQVGGSSWVTCKTGRIREGRSRSSALLWVAGYYTRVRSQTRAMSVRRGGVMGRRPSWLCQALINPRAGSLGRYHQPCGTACHTFPWTQIGFSLQAHLHPRAGLGPAGLAGPGEAHTFSACQSTEQERAAL